jgi:leader peptidase (prepilin peptidase)/N-methyltransferase
MELFVIYAALVLFGATLGSFAGAMVWRIRAKQLADDKAHGEKVDSRELKKLKKLNDASLMKDRSQCLRCDYQLRWYDLIPVVSWLTLRGKCRHCKKPIGKFELLIELGLIAFFTLSYIYWPGPLDTALAVSQFILWLIAGVLMAILFAYDAKWFLLPSRETWLLALVGGVGVVLAALQTGEYVETGLSALWAVGVLSGLYLVLYLVSSGKWVGFGDVKLGIGLGLLLIDWQLALLALFLANFIGTLAVTPMLLTKKMTRTSQVPFGPLLIIGTVLAWFIGPPIIDWYLGLLGV